MQEWSGPGDGLGSFISQQTQACLRVYLEDPQRIEEDAAIEATAAEGGYGRKQLFELVQNAADAMRLHPGRIKVVLSGRFLYVANAGQAFTKAGVQSLLASHLSRKSDDAIGQFGLGFKSVTAISDNVVVFSRTASFAFDRRFAETTIRESGLESPKYPMLRVARSIDPDVEARSDNTLSSLMGWASTIVRVSLKSGRADLARDVASFPASFLLFSSDVREMNLEDVELGLHRGLRRDNAVDEILIKDNEGTSHWVVASTTFRPSSIALQDAGHASRRSSVALSWAAPRASTRDLGEFWAYFPTGIKTTLSGILNGPWKLSADRIAMIPGSYNEELLTLAVPRLVAAGMSKLLTADDPGAVLDVLPARGNEARSWADNVVNGPVFAAVAKESCLPNLEGQLRVPKELSLHPAGLPDAWKSVWSTPHPATWVHPSVDRTRERRLKAERLFTAGGGSAVTLVEWIEATVADRTPESSARALRLAALIVGTNRNYLEDVRKSRIVLLENGTLVRPARGKVFLRGEIESDAHDFIHAQLAVADGVGEALSVLGIEILDPAGELRAALQARPVGPAWGKIWRSARELDQEKALLMFSEELPKPLVSSVFAQMKSGRWRPLSECFLAGEVIPRDSPRDADFLVNPAFHAQDSLLLERCGAVAAPRLVQGIEDEPWLKIFKAKHVSRYRSSLTGATPPAEKISVTGPPIPWPLELMDKLSVTSRAALTQKVLDLGSFDRWKVMHTASSQTPVKVIANPAANRIAEFGAIPTTIGPVEYSLCLHPDAALPDYYPKAAVTGSWASALQLPMDLDKWDAQEWKAFLRDTEQRRPQVLAAVYASAARSGITAPDKIFASRGAGVTARFGVAEVAVTDDATVYSSLILAGIPSLQTESAADRAALMEQWGLADGREMLREETVATPDSEAGLLLDRFPPLRVYDREIADLDNIEIQTCSSIDVLISTPRGQETRAADSHREGSRIFVRNGADRDVLGRLAEALRLSINAESVLEQMQKRARNQLLLAIRAEDELAEKLVLAVDAEALKARLPRTAVDDLERSKRGALSELELAELALSVHGFNILVELRQELREAGLAPPERWAGSREATRFVESLGFSREYAGFPGANLAAGLDVQGPVELHPLHKYQERVVARIQELLTRSGAERRGMVTLPTGAGKTRVAIEAVVRYASSKHPRGPVLWIAQSDELCEQAVQAWAYIWRALGDGPLAIARFWSRNEAVEAADRFQVVVATIDKLRAAIDKPQYGWLKDPELIIVDEAHTSIAPSYTDVFRWLSGESITTRMTTPLLGLTATAYRGHNEVETDRLVKRYGSNKLDDGVFGGSEPYAYLQEHRVLAEVRQQVLKGMDIPWTAELEKYLGLFGTLPRDVEGTVGRNFERNREIIESITNQPDDWTILLFASSVEHARTLAAELSYYGVPARPISGGTDPGLRRRYVEQFRDGEIRVLTNYNVLTQGFDAPRVRAVYVTRPTFSPNLYQQMIGRGLRGPRNGGSDEVLIVNVADNLEKHGGQLAFHHFDHLWGASQ